MNIVVVDGHTLNPGDLDWEALRQLGSCEIHDRTDGDERRGRAKYAEIVLTNKVPFDRDLLSALPKLKYIGVTATGFNIIDVDAARERGIVVTNVPSYGTASVAQMTLALLLELTQRAGHHSQRVREGGWTRSQDWCFWDYPLVELEGLTLGIVGYGSIGQAVAKLGRAFGMRVLANTRTPPGEAQEDVTFVELEELFRSSDVISLHCPLTEETRHLVNRDRIERMKSSAFLINTSRGPLVDEGALADALDQDRLAGAALDVLSAEPPRSYNPLLNAKNCVITPHIAWATRAARRRLMEVAVQNVRAFLDGEPVNVVR